MLWNRYRGIVAGVVNSWMGCKEHCFHTRWADDYNEVRALPPPPLPHLPLHLPVSAVDCADPQCGGHGVCVRGECVCSAGWAGVSCDDPLPACQEQCSGHGTYLTESDTCTCQPNWTGPDCYTGKNPRITATPVGEKGRKKE